MPLEEIALKQGSWFTGGQQVLIAWKRLFCGSPIFYESMLYMKCLHIHILEGRTCDKISGKYWIIEEQDPVSTMQKTWLADYSSFLVWSDLEKGITYGCDHYGAVSNHFPVYSAICGMVTTERTNNWVILEQACSWPVRRQSFARMNLTYPRQ